MYLTQICPNCNKNLQGDSIPEQYKKYYNNATHFSKIIGIQYLEKYDGVTDWMCPYCKYTEPRLLD